MRRATRRSVSMTEADYLRFAEHVGNREHEGEVESLTRWVKRACEALMASEERRDLIAERAEVLGLGDGLQGPVPVDEVIANGN